MKYLILFIIIHIKIVYEVKFFKKNKNFINKKKKKDCKYSNIKKKNKYRLNIIILILNIYNYFRFFKNDFNSSIFDL